MHVPSITAFYLGILGLIYAALALRVAGMRRSNRVLFGDAENAKLRTAIRVHANFIEYVPIITLLVALLEMSGMASEPRASVDGRPVAVAPAPPAGHGGPAGHLAIQRRPGRRHPAHHRRAGCRRHRRHQALLAVLNRPAASHCKTSSVYCLSSPNFDSVKISLDDPPTRALGYLYDVKISPERLS